MDLLESLEDGTEIILAKKKNEAFELEFRLMCKKIFLVLFTFVACTLCMEWCKPCLVAVMIFSGCMCSETRMLWVPFLISLVMVIATYMSVLKGAVVLTEDLSRIQAEQEHSDNTNHFR